jgi:protein-S-isoprenylcysteine O-methyltransferase Ste14
LNSYVAIFFVPIIPTSFQLSSFVKYFGAIISLIGFVVILVAILQLNKNLTPFPTPKDSGEHINTGLYKFVRHPIYSGIFLGSFGIGLYTGSYWQLFVSITLLILFYFKSNYEESLLIQKYTDYKEYMKKTRKFF